MGRELCMLYIIKPFAIVLLIWINLIKKKSNAESILLSGGNIFKLLKLFYQMCLFHLNVLYVWWLCAVPCTNIWQTNINRCLPAADMEDKFQKFGDNLTATKVKVKLAASVLCLKDRGMEGLKLDSSLCFPQDDNVPHNPLSNWQSIRILSNSCWRSRTQTCTQLN